jgi:hypothetical protein
MRQDGRQRVTRASEAAMPPAPALLGARSPWVDAGGEDGAAAAVRETEGCEVSCSRHVAFVDTRTKGDRPEVVAIEASALGATGVPRFAPTMAAA